MGKRERLLYVSPSLFTFVSVADGGYFFLMVPSLRQPLYYRWPVVMAPAPKPPQQPEVI